jgi:hypothetical protein
MVNVFTTNVLIYIKPQFDSKFLQSKYFEFFTTWLICFKVFEFLKKIMPKYMIGIESRKVIENKLKIKT